MNFDSSQYLTEIQVSEFTGFALPTLRNWRFCGKGPVYYKIGRSVRYKLEDVASFMTSGRIEPREVL